MRVVVVGGGIAGLAAARRLALRPSTSVTLLEASSQLGGKLRTSQFAGVEMDEGAEQFLVRRPEALELLHDVGLADDLVSPRTTQAAVWSRGRLRRLPSGTVLGVPGDLLALARSGVLTPGQSARAALEAVLPRTRRADHDVAVGPYVAARFGRGVVDRLVDPLLGGVYAGRADDLSLAATMPQLRDELARHRTLSGAARAAAGASPAGAPVFATIRGGLGRLPPAVLRDTDVSVRTGATVREVQRRPHGYRVVVGDTRAPETLGADAVVLAVPAASAARLLAGFATDAAVQVRAIDYASVAIVTLAFPRTLPADTGISGFLVPAVEGRSTKAVTFSSVKWEHLDDRDVTVVRASIGRYGAAYELQRDDDELAATAARDIADLAGLSSAPVETRVTRWGGGLPQYRPGHRDRLARLRAALPAGVAVCGAAYDGVGIPACIRSGYDAADVVTSGLRQSVGGRREEEEGA